jgi:hypothetical protein
MNKPRGVRPFSDLLHPTLADALKSRGFASADIIGHWPDIVGTRLAEQSLPLRIQWPPRPKTEKMDLPRQPATLILRVESAFALEVEMGARQIIERINAVFGWRCVGKLRIRQGPIEHPASRAAPVTPELSPNAAKQLAADLDGIEDDGLRQALERLGRHVRGSKPVTAP